MAPTVLDFLGIKKPPSFAAPSLWPVLQGKSAKVTEIAVSSPTLSHPGMKRPQPTERASITDGRWLLVFGCQGSSAPGDRTASVDSEQRVLAPLTGERLVPELYNLEADPGCLQNVIAQQKERAADLHHQFAEFLRHSSMRRDHLHFFEKI